MDQQRGSGGGVVGLWVGWMRFYRAFWALAGAYWSTPARWQVWGLLAALVLLTVGQVTIPLLLNLWNKYLFDALEVHAIPRFLWLVGALGLITLYNMAVVSLHLVVKRRLQVGWRSWLTERLLGEWMSPGHHDRVRDLQSEQDNPDGRIAEDVRIATEYAIDLAHSAFYCLLLLASFIQVLWVLSGPADLAFDGFAVHLPGHLVWIALAYAGVGTLVGLWLGQPLIRAAEWRQSQEANFRFGLVHARETSLEIAIARTEAEERGRLRGLYRHAVAAWDRQTTALRNLFLFSGSWSVLSQGFPFLAAAPRYLAGDITLGGMMQAAQALQQTIAALAWPIDNVPRLAEWRASVERVLSLHAALTRLPTPKAAIAVGPGSTPQLAFRDVTVAEPDGAVLLDRFSTEIGPGEHVLLVGDPATAETLIKVVSGVWPWGCGRVELPEGASIFLMPQRPYLPRGSLREAIACPPVAPPADDLALHEAMHQVGLAHLIPRLDERRTWEHTLTPAERQRIGFARLLLQRPHWIFIHHALDALDPAGKAQMLALLARRFPDATVVTIGDDGLLTDFYGRRLILPPGLTRPANGTAPPSAPNGQRPNGAH